METGVQGGSKTALASLIDSVLSRAKAWLLPSFCRYVEKKSFTEDKEDNANKKRTVF